MIIREIGLQNFGIYADNHKYDLHPVPTGNFHRPIVLFRGKNGVGKTTLVEAMRLCLHGSLVVGSRVSQREYNNYLRSRVHHHSNGGNADIASVAVVFDYVSAGKKREYRVLRNWEVFDNRVDKDVTIWEDGELLEFWDNDQKDQFLRELAPPGILDIFFFDGERIRTLADSEEVGDALLADSIRSLLGLDLVEQLSRDLDVYIARQESHEQVAELQKQLEDANVRLVALTDELDTLRQKRSEIFSECEDRRNLIALREQELASQGGEYANRREMLQSQGARLQEEILVQRKVVHELCSGLFSFAISPKMLRSVAEQLELEREYEQAEAARQVLVTSLDQIQDKMLGDEYWESVGFTPEPFARLNLFSKLAADLRHITSEPDLAPDQLVLRVSDEDRDTLLRWIDQALSDIPVTFTSAVEKLSKLQTEFTGIQTLLAQAPQQESLQYLLEELGELHQQLGAHQAELLALDERIVVLEKRLDWHEAQRQRIHEKINDQESDVSRLYLATKTQQLLADYKQRLAATKITDIEHQLVFHFNQLCRKESFLDYIEINPRSFQVTLYRLGQRISRRQLSAGENQLFAIATLWALREVSGRPMPVVIDTPLSRLDSEHRLTMIQEFFPHTSHQLIMLATDAEIGDEILEHLRPAISHVYEMHYNPVTNAMTHERLDNDGPSQQVIPIERVTVL